MTATRTLDPWFAAALGAAGAVASQHLGPLALSSGWTAPACGAVLVAGAVGVLATHGLRRRDRRVVPVAPPRFVHADEPAWALGLKPSEWVAASGALAVPDAETEGYLRARLVASLAPVPPKCEGSREVLLPEPIALLALAFATRAACGKGVRREVGSNILAGLREAHEAQTDADRHEVLARTRRDIPLFLGARLLSGGPVAEAYKRRLSLHGTRETFLMGLLEEARRHGGILASAEFVWLKGVDRPLWYALNNLDRRNVFVEGLAAMVHYQAEVLQGRALTEPRVEEAIEGLAELCRTLRAEGGTGAQVAEDAA